MNLTIRERGMVSSDRAILGTLAIIASLALCGCAGADLADRAVNNPAEGWYTWGTKKAEVVTDAKVEGGKARRVLVAPKPANAWDAGVVAPVVKPVKKGDVIVWAFWARAEVLPPGDDFTEISGRVYEDKQPSPTVVPQTTFLVGRKWKLFHASATAEKDYPANTISAGMVIGSDAQTLDFGPLYISDFGPGFDISKLPQLKSPDGQ
jgi:hypothetical protein